MMNPLLRMIRRAALAAMAVCGMLLVVESRGEDLTPYGREWEQIKQDLNQARSAHDAKIREIQSKHPPGSQRDALIESENAAFRQKNQDLGARRDKIHQKVIEEVNARAKSGSSDASAPMKATKGTKPGEEGFRGTDGDLDTGSGSRTAGKVQDVLDDMGINVESRARGGTIEFGDDFNLTVNKQGKMGRPGSAAHQTQVGVDARNPETFVSQGMVEDQVGRKAVEVQDNIKKARKAYDAPPDRVMGDPDMQQQMAKSTKNIMETNTLSESQIEDILTQSGSTESVQQFKDRMERIKEGRAKPSDLTPENVESTQKASRKIAETASAQSTSQAHKDMADAQRRINDLEAKGDPASRQQAQKMREDLVDSRERLEQTRKTNMQPQEDLPSESVRKGKPGQTFDADGNPTQSGPKDRTTEAPPADADGPGGQKPGKSSPATDSDGPGGKPGRQGAATDPDGPGAKAPAAADGPGGAKAKGAGKESLKGKAGRLAGEFTDGVVIISQAGKIREGIKEEDPKKVLEGLAGQDIADRSDVQGGKDYVEDMDTLLSAKSAEAKSAAVGKLKRMGATAEELAEYESKYDSDPAKARAVVREVKARGGVDTAPNKALEDAGPEESSWTAKDQITEGAKQAGSYGKTVLDGVALGAVSRGEEAESDLSTIVQQSGHVDRATAERVISTLYTELRDRGASPEEARAALKDYFRTPRDVHELVAELKERDPEKAGGSGRTREGLGVDHVEVEEDPEGVGTRIKDTFVNAGKAVVDTVDKAAGVVGDTVNDIMDAATGVVMDATGVGSAKNDSEREAAENEELARLGIINLKEQLIRDGATPEQAARAIENFEKERPQDLRNLRKELRARREKEEQERLAREKAEKQRLAREQAEKKRLAQEKAEKERLAKEKAERNKPTSKPWSEMSDAERRNALKANEDAAWAKFGETVQANPDAAVRILDAFSDQRDTQQAQRGQEGHDLAAAGAAVADASTAGDRQVQDAQAMVNQAGQQAQDAKGATASTTAQADAKDSLISQVGAAVAEGVAEGGKAAGTAFGNAAAQKAGQRIFRGRDQRDGDDSDADDGEHDGSASPSGVAVVAASSGARRPAASGHGPSRPASSRGNSHSGSTSRSPSSGGSSGSAAAPSAAEIEAAYRAGHDWGRYIVNTTMGSAEVQAGTRSRYGRYQHASLREAFRRGYADGSRGSTAATPPAAPSPPTVSSPPPAPPAPPTAPPTAPPAPPVAPARKEYRAGCPVCSERVTYSHHEPGGGAMHKCSRGHIFKPSEAISVEL
jgi:hypothetical protein